ncbi:MAG: DNA/RNA non-specific endonuclease [Prevotella sp.]|nr:DNA/RNA non-specific endonuclease [Prevotella sp.]
MMNIKHIPTLLFAAFLSISTVSCSSDEESENNGIDIWHNGGTNRNTPTANCLEASRIEFPKTKGNKSIILKYYSGDAYGLNYCVEWDTEKKSQRWSCYFMVDHHHSNNDREHTYSGNAGRYEPMSNPGNHPGDRQYPWDPQLPEQYRWSEDLFVRSGYDHGHICPSADRQYSKEANYQTFYMTNMQPQRNAFNAKLWAVMEQKVRDITPKTIGDTLYVCKGGTIDNESQILTRIQDKMIVPKYFYMALLLKKGNQISAFAFWAEHTNVDHSGDPLRNYVITIDELEQRTGIDFFCNLPDDIENKVESNVAYNYWGF